MAPPNISFATAIGFDGAYEKRLVTPITAGKRTRPLKNQKLEVNFNLQLTAFSWKAEHANPLALWTRSLKVMKTLNQNRRDAPSSGWVAFKRSVK